MIFKEEIYKGRRIIMGTPDALEPLPSEAEIEDYMQRQMRSPEKIPFPSLQRPQTATQASILYENGKRGMDGALEAMRNRIDQEIIQMMSLPREMLEGRKAPVPNNGWMPAGTYLPLGDEKLKTDVWVRYNRMDIRLGPLVGDRYDSYERGPDISTKIPPHNRRLPSRTLTWGNLGDDYDLLPDAE